MVNQKIKIRDKHRSLKKTSKVFLIIIIIAIILAAVFFLGFKTKKPTQKVVIENPLKDIVFANTNEAGEVNQEAVIEQGVIDFNKNYIIYIMAALGIGDLHKSLIGYGTPKVQLIIDNEIWSAEVNGGLRVSQNSIEDPDLKVRMSKEEAVRALLSPNIKEFLKGSVRNGNTGLELVAGKVELASKGYLKMYTDLTGEVIEVEE